MVEQLNPGVIQSQAGCEVFKPQCSHRVFSEGLLIKHRVRSQHWISAILAKHSKSKSKRTGHKISIFNAHIH